MGPASEEWIEQENNPEGRGGGGGEPIESFDLDWGSTAGTGSSDEKRSVSNIGEQRGHDGESVRDGKMAAASYPFPNTDSFTSFLFAISCWKKQQILSGIRTLRGIPASSSFVLSSLMSPVKKKVHMAYPRYFTCTYFSVQVLPATPSGRRHFVLSVVAGYWWGQTERGWRGWKSVMPSKRDLGLRVRCVFTDQDSVLRSRLSRQQHHTRLIDVPSHHPPKQAQVPHLTYMRYYTYGIHMYAHHPHQLSLVPTPTLHLPLKNICTLPPPPLVVFSSAHIAS